MICVVCQQENAWAEVGAVCQRCYGRMDGALRQIPRLLSEVSLERGRGTGQHVTGSREAPLPLLVDPLDLSMPVRPGSTGVRLRGAWSALGGDPDQIGHLSVATELDGYARMWAEDRNEHGPHPQVPLLCPWLLDRLDWACEDFPAVDEFASTLSRLYGALYAANGLGSPRPQVRDRACPRCGLLTLTLEPSGYTECGNVECRAMLTESEYQHHLRALIYEVRAPFEEHDMRKIPTLFRRDPNDLKRVTREVHPDCQWVLDGEGTATRKYDGTCVLLDEEGTWWARREVKPGKAAPEHYLPTETDPTTGKTVGWEPIGQSAFAKYHAQAVESHVERRPGHPLFAPGTYELCGPKVNGNPEDYTRHLLVRHEDAEVLGDPLADGPGEPPRDFDGLAKWLAEFDGEGIVWHHPDGRMAKLKRKDFPGDGK